MLIKDITRADCLELLEHAKVGRLACVHDGQPYIVPMSFECDGDSLYSVSRLGRKIEWMRVNPSVCIQVDEIRNRSEWISVIIHGRYEELSGLSVERTYAYQLLQRNAEWWEPGCAKTTIDNKELHTDWLFFRIRIDQITGRQGMPDVKRKESGLGRWANWISPGSYS